MSEKIPYEQVIGRMRLDIDYIAEGAYQKGLSQGYKDGYEAGQHEATTLEYEQGLNDAWEAAKRICTNWMIGDQTLAEIFGQCKDIGTIMHENTAQEAVNKIKAYEEQQKADEIKVGDEVYANTPSGKTQPFIIIKIYDGDDGKYYTGINTDGNHVQGGLNYIKTGRHFPQVVELLKAMKEGAE